MSDFERAIQEHSGALIRYAWACTGSIEDAQDVVQTALLNATNAIRRGHRPARLKPWLFAIAHHEICAWKSKGDSHRNKVLRRAQMTASPQDPRLDDLREAISKLAEPYGPMLALRFVQGFSVEEISELLDKPPGTVKVTLWRALDMLRTSFRKSSP